MILQMAEFYQREAFPYTCQRTAKLAEESATDKHIYRHTITANTLQCITPTGRYIYEICQHITGANQHLMQKSYLVDPSSLLNICKVNLSEINKEITETNNEHFITKVRFICLEIKNTCMQLA